MSSGKLHQLILRGDLAQIRQIITSKQFNQDADVNAFDSEGYTPLMRAVARPEADLELVKLLLENGAAVNKECLAQYHHGSSVMALALGRGNPEVIKLLLQHGADIHYRRNDGYRALIDAVHYRNIQRDTRLIDLLKLLIINKVELSDVTNYGESGLRVLSRLGRFDAVKVLLNAGADPAQLKWTPLMRAIAVGSLDDVQKEVKGRALLEDKDFWERTPWLLAIQTGEVAKATFLYENGASTAAKGRCEKPPLFYAIESNSISMLRWMLEIGASLEEADKFGTTPLMTAVENNNLEAVDELLKTGADLHLEWNGQTALASIQSSVIGFRLLNAGADPQHISFEGRRILLGLNPDASRAQLDVSLEEFLKGRSRRFGAANPEQFHDKFCEEMIRSGISAYQACAAFGASSDVREVSPVWCACRFGQSITFLADKRIIQIAGEHEDYYDPDFCIYNDVFVHHPDGTIDLYGYPQEVFPPTDFHTASLMDDQYIWIIGSLGYAGTRLYGKTPVYRLDTTSLEIELIETTGDNPGWIFKHTATVIPESRIRISGGMIANFIDSKETHDENIRVFFLDTERRKWSEELV